MRHIVPENRLRTYEVRDVIRTLADEGTMLELRRDFGRTMVTALIRLEGRTVGVLANDPKHLGGAVDSDGSDKGARFMQLCDAFDIPVVNFCDTPGIMVGPEAEKTERKRVVARMFRWAERRVGKEWVGPCKSRWARDSKKKKEEENGRK